MRRSGLSFSLSLLLASTAFAASAQPGRPLPPVSEIHVLIGNQLEARARVYGQGDLDMLARDLKSDLEDELRRASRLGPGGVRLILVITDAMPNHPTQKQLQDRPNLDPRVPNSSGWTAIEGAEIRPDGSQRRLRYYQRPFQLTAHLQSLWGDAEDTFHQFAHDYAVGKQ